MPASHRTVLCGCCNQWVSPSTERRHRLGQAAPRFKATSTFNKTLISGSCPPKSQAHAVRTGYPDLAVPDPSFLYEEVIQYDPNFPDHGHVVSEGTGLDSHTVIEEALARASDSVQTQRHFAAATESDEDSPGHADDEADESNQSVTSDSDDENLDFSDIQANGLSAWDSHGESFERDVTEMSAHLSDDDLAILRVFALKVRSHMTAKTFSMLPYAFPSAPPLSLKATRSRVSALSGVTPVLYDCCINSCCCFVGPNINEESCPHCSEARRNTHGEPRAQFTYIPLVPRLVAMYRNKDLSSKMRYRASEHHHDPNHFTDIFDGSTYRSLLDRYVTVNGTELQHKYFSDPRDIALGMATDGFAPFRNRKTTAWPIIMYNFNLPPETRFHRQFTICVGVIPGPKKPKDFDSFLWPLIEELLILAVGTRAYDALAAQLFALRAWLILISGDIPALSMVMRMKGHNGYAPCRMCKITGLRIPDSRSTTHYVPLDRSCHPDVRSSQSATKRHDPSNLPMRSHDEILAQAREVQLAATNAESERLAKQYGIKGIPLLSHLSSITFPSSFPYDFMHLIFENAVPNLLALWTGDFKGLGQGHQSYELSPSVWDAIGAATSASGPTLPYAFCSRPVNIATYEKAQCTADSWSFWTQYIGPVVMEHKFLERKYYTHFVAFVRLLRCCLQFDLTREDVDYVRKGFEQWVVKYEEFYYQYSPDRLAVCTVTAHALLHIADSIEAMGPVWTSWAFPMERFCGSILPAIKSRRHPYASIDRYIVDSAHLTQVKLLYNLEDHLSLQKPRESELEHAFSHASYETCILLPPHRSCEALESRLLKKVISHLATTYNTSTTVVKTVCGREHITQWGKVRRLNGGDTIHAASMAHARHDTRDATFIRYETLVDKFARQRTRKPEFILKTFFGRLQHVFVVVLPASLQLKTTNPSVHFLAAIETCQIERSTDLDIHYYSTLGGLDMVDITCVQCVVGRVETSNGWAILDRSGSLSRALYAADGDDGQG